jgi:polar amino acid transport system permease protein
VNSLFSFLNLYLPEFIQGAAITLELTIVALAIGALVGLPAALARVYAGGWLGRFALAYIELFRGTPLLIQLFIVYYGLPDFGVILPELPASFIALGLNSGAYQAEYFRGAIQAIGSGQMMAARSVGMSQLKALRYIILPQALRLVLPPWSNEAVTVLKATAVVFVIAVPDLMTRAKILSSRFFNPIESYLAVAVAYIVLVALFTLLMHALERRLRIPGLELEVARH